MKRYDLIIVGAGPAGLSAAVEAAKCGLEVIVFDENDRPGGQLIKQIHKFFGSKEHKAKERGFAIGKKLLEEAESLGVTVCLRAAVAGIYLDHEVAVHIGDRIEKYKGDAIIVATGAAENMVPFPGWTLPGVIGAGAAQTMMNQQFLRPGNRVLMLGTGNVGLVVSYQLMQAGCEVVCLVDAAPRIGGYGVHAAKVTRCGVPVYLSHTIVSAEGKGRVERVTIGRIGAGSEPAEEKTFEVDTVCLAVGLSPMAQLLKMAGCEMQEDPAKGGHVPLCAADGQTSIPGLFAAGDVSGIEEASSAMIEGRIAGLSAAKYLGWLEQGQFDKLAQQARESLESLHQGMFAPGRKGKPVEKTDEGCPVSQSLLTRGYLAQEEIDAYPGVKRLNGIHPVLECTQNIPCNPCQDACPKGCIKIGSTITQLPEANEGSTCIGCGLCVAACPGQAIFLVNSDYSGAGASVTLPYEFLPYPKAGDKGMALDRSGKPVCEAEVVSVKQSPGFDKTALLTMKVAKGMEYHARFFKAEVSGNESEI